jgi:hypothetical protein
MTPKEIALRQVLVEQEKKVMRERIAQGLPPVEPKERRVESPKSVERAANKRLSTKEAKASAYAERIRAAIDGERHELVNALFREAAARGVLNEAVEAARITSAERVWLATGG